MEYKITDEELASLTASQREARKILQRVHESPFALDTRGKEKSRQKLVDAAKKAATNSGKSQNDLFIFLEDMKQEEEKDEESGFSDFLAQFTNSYDTKEVFGRIGIINLLNMSFQDHLEEYVPGVSAYPMLMRDIYRDFRQYYTGDSPISGFMNRIRNIIVSDIIMFARGLSLSGLNYEAIRQFSGELASSIEVTPLRKSFHFNVISNSDHYKYVALGIPQWNIFEDKLIKIPIEFATTLTDRDLRNNVGGYIIRRVTKEKLNSPRTPKPFITDIMTLVWDEYKNTLWKPVEDTVIQFFTSRSFGYKQRLQTLKAQGL